MKLETAVILTKGVCFLVLGFTAPLASGLAQWFDTEEWPPTINWIVILAACFGGAATQMLAFLSQSFGNYKAQMRSDDAAAATVAPPKP